MAAAAAERGLRDTPTIVVASKDVAVDAVPYLWHWRAVGDHPNLEVWRPWSLTNTWTPKRGSGFLGTGLYTTIERQPVRTHEGVRRARLLRVSSHDGWVLEGGLRGAATHVLVVRTMDELLRVRSMAVHLMKYMASYASRAARQRIDSSLWRFPAVSPTGYTQRALALLTDERVAGRDPEKDSLLHVMYDMRALPMYTEPLLDDEDLSILPARPDRPTPRGAPPSDEYFREIDLDQAPLRNAELRIITHLWGALIANDKHWQRKDKPVMLEVQQALLYMEKRVRNALIELNEEQVGATQPAEVLRSHDGFKLAPEARLETVAMRQPINYFFEGLRIAGVLNYAADSPWGGSVLYDYEGATRTAEVVAETA